MERIAQALLSNRLRDMWSEADKTKGHNQTSPCSIDGATCNKENANVFYEKYNKLYTIRMTCVISSLRLIMTLNKGVILIMF